MKKKQRDVDEKEENIEKGSLPATTRLVPMNESMNVACRIPASAIVRDAKRQNSVAIPSMNAPKYACT